MEARRFDQLLDDAELEREQRRLAALAPEPWWPSPGPVVVAGAFVAFARGEQGPGRPGDRAFVGAAATSDVSELARLVVEERAGAAYRAGFLAAREGAMIASAFRRLLDEVRPEVVIVDATGRDHPRRAGLALHLGAVLELPSIGVTHRPLVAVGPEPDDVVGATGELRIGEDVVGCWLRTRRGVRPVAVHPGWRTDVHTAIEVVQRVTARARTPEPLRLARTAAREARADAERRGRRPR